MSTPRRFFRYASTRLRALAGDAEFREWMWFCAPALLVAVAVRAVMTAQMPYGYMQFDTVDFLATPHRFLKDWGISVHMKRTFLVPFLYTLPFLLRVPALIAIPLAQHALGVLTVAMGGGLVRLWFAQWRWIIVPATLLLAVDPVLLWFEQALMSECVYLFCVFALALAGTLYARRQSGARFAFLLASLFFTAAARPEGRLFFAFGFGLVFLVHFGRWKVLALRLACVAATAAVVLPLTRTGQSGQLLLATVITLAPDVSKVAPDLSEPLRKLRDGVALEEGEVNTELTTMEKALANLTRDYLAAHKELRTDKNSLCLKLAIEACKNRPFDLPALAAKKFLISNAGASSIGFIEPKLHRKLEVGFTRTDWLPGMWKGLTGRELKDREAMVAFVGENYHPIDWYSALDRAWLGMTLTAREGGLKSGDSWIPNLSYFYILALAGMAASLVLNGPMRAMQFPWLLTLAGLWFAVELTGVINARYRYVFEPFCVIYALSALAAPFAAFHARGTKSDASLSQKPSP